MKRARKGEVEGRGGRHSYATPLLQHRAQIGLNPALQTEHFGAVKTGI